MKEKKCDSMLCNSFTRENARACACARFFIKCLEWAKTYAKWFWDDFEHFKILRAHWRADVRARARFLTWNWPDWYWPWSWKIWMRNDLPLWRYDHKLIFRKFFTKWRLDDVISQGQGRKICCVLWICLYICVLNFKIFDWAIFKLSCTQKSGSK